jgi:hypothetical protein
LNRIEKEQSTITEKKNMTDLDPDRDSRIPNPNPRKGEEEQGGFYLTTAGRRMDTEQELNPSRDCSGATISSVGCSCCSRTARRRLLLLKENIRNKLKIELRFDKSKP